MDTDGLDDGAGELDVDDVLEGAPVEAAALDDEELTGPGHGCTLVSSRKTAQLFSVTQLVKTLLSRQNSNAARLVSR
jgi:hypothetical protein